MQFGVAMITYESAETHEHFWWELNKSSMQTGSWVETVVPSTALEQGDDAGGKLIKRPLLQGDTDGASPSKRRVAQEGVDGVKPLKRPRSSTI